MILYYKLKNKIFNNIKMTTVQIPNEELLHFKEKVTRWITIDKKIIELQSQLKDLKNIKNKELEPQMTDFMVKYKINDLNTEAGKLKCSERKTKKGITNTYIRDNLSKVLDNTELVDKAMENILGNREVVITHKLTKLKPKKVI